MLLRFEELIAKIFQFISRNFVKKIFETWLNIEVIGIEILKNIQKPLIFVSNHPSLIDPLLITIVIPKKFLPIRWAAHRYFFDSDYGWLLWLFGAFPIEGTKKEPRAGIKKAINLIQSGSIVGFFPEGHLSEEENKIGAILPGIVAIHKKTKGLIAPVVLNGIFPLFRDAGKIIPTIEENRKKIKIIFGRPFNVNTSNPDIMTDIIKKSLENLLPIKEENNGRNQN